MVSNGTDRDRARSERARPRVVLFGMRYVGSPPVLRELLAAGYDVRAVVMPGPPGMMALPSLPGTNVWRGNFIPLADVSTEPGNTPGENVDDMARAAGIPVLLVGSLRRPEVVAAIAAYQPDVIAVSCFSLRLPPPVLALPRFGCLNVHPSLLPRGRGSDPVFWTLRRGERETGITIHLMDEGYDSGPILLQERVAVPEGVRLLDFERELSEQGGRLLVTAIDGLVAGEIVPTPQDDRLATMAPEPIAEDYVVPTDRPAEWAYNFVRGVAPLNGPLMLHVAGTNERSRLHDAISYSRDGRQKLPIERSDNEILVQFAPGVVRFSTAG
ncbi:MAG: methionyl-tRNA formyltransferase [Thermomicrobiales bacterium]|nr:methionyl-tRNA formyltransferase [Thermomicrobiales bacterium]